MILLAICLMAVIVFISRYLFLEPKLPIKLGTETHRLLNYSSPAVLSAIWAPIVFAPSGELDLSVSNPFLLGAVMAALIAWKTHNVLLTTVLSMTGFLIIKLGVF
ncbi:AzlD domain-containing protein [Vibrio sp. AK197]|uniref:AzlD domain-containing protein n=1 Tax=Vibrio olivae TaxID=1243002 RepID=A0ABV5HP82_9VIBR